MYNYQYSSAPMGAGRGCTGERKFKNERGNTFVKDSMERITSFQYNDVDPTYHFEYDKEGTINGIDRSDGWNWRRVRSNEFTGWVIHNYWDCWKVEDKGCSIYVDESGIKTADGMSDQLALPEA